MLWPRRFAPTSPSAGQDRHFIPQPSGSEAKLLLMPAWTSTPASGSSAASSSPVFPDNAKVRQAVGLGSYVLMSGDTGEPLAVIDGAALTAWRTACASALAARYLAREDASHLVMIGAGRWRRISSARMRGAADHARDALEPHRARAPSRPRSRSPTPASSRDRDDLEDAVREADIVSCATLSPSRWSAAPG